MENIQDANNNLRTVLGSLEFPVLIVSTKVGKGIISIAEALKESIGRNDGVYHVVIEDILPKNAVREDLSRYYFISNKLPFLLYIIYKFPLIYYRKLFREKYLRFTDLSSLESVITSRRIKTVICASHRPAFWFSALKKRTGLDFKLWGMLSEFGRNLGWKYIFWEVMDGYFSPVDRKGLDFKFPSSLQFVKIDLPAGSGFYDIASLCGDRNSVLFVAGHWGQVFVNKALQIVEDILSHLPDIKIHIVCGTNSALHSSFRKKFYGNDRVVLYSELKSLLPVMKQCASIITKPGISTIVEAHASRRQIFLIKGMPVAEDNNARYALSNFGAQKFSIQAFKSWHMGQARGV